MKNLNWFEEKVFEGLCDCNVDLQNLISSGENIGVAVSGGADSVSLLTSLLNILNNYKIPLKVITVNHNIRKREETCGDVDFVVKLCSDFKNKGFDVNCTVKELAPGEVSAYAKENNSGIEDAARTLRYKIFEQFIKEEKCGFLCLAHNQNDQIETVLMRFLQGADTDSKTGIPCVRDKYVRPLLKIKREEIEKYLKEYSWENQNKKELWRTDSTNQENVYLRNRIRNELVPFLNERFSGWQNAVETGVVKNQLDKEIIEEQVKKVPFVYENNQVVIERKDFDGLLMGIKTRVLKNSMNLLGENHRIPFVFLIDVIDSMSKKSGENQFVKSFNSIEILVKKDKLFIKKGVKNETETYFSDIITETKINEIGEIKINFGDVELIICRTENGLKIHGVSKNGINCEYLLDCSLPVRIRSFCCGDEILDSSNSLKKVSDVFSDWHVPEKDRSLIPLVEELGASEPDKFGENRITCILGAFLGFKDWIVK